MTPTSNNKTAKNQITTLRTGIPKYDPASILSKQELSTLIHKIGHEIGNPLTAIISLGSIIERFADDLENPKPDLGSKISSYANSIISESWRINQHNERLVMLLSHKIGNLYLLNIADVINQAFKKFQLRNKNKNLILNIASPAKEPPHAFIDNDQFVILISELILNACNYQAYEYQNNDVQIEAKIESFENHSTLTLSNRIKEPIAYELEKLFEPYVSKYSDKKHLGLGFIMCLAILKKVKGEIKILEQEINQELYFTVEITLPNKEYGNS